MLVKKPKNGVNTAPRTTRSRRAEYSQPILNKVENKDSPEETYLSVFYPVSIARIDIDCGGSS